MALEHPHINTHSALSQSLETWIIKCEDYCRQLSASLGPLIITLATTGIYNYNTLFWSSTSFPLLLSLLLRIPPLEMSAAGRLWVQGTNVARPRMARGDICPAQGVEDDEPRSLSSLRSVGQTCDHAQMPRPNDLNSFPGELWGPLDTSAAWSRRLLRQDFSRPNSPYVRPSINVLQRNNPPHNSSFQCRYGLPSPASKICAAAPRRTDRKLCVGVQYGISRSRLCTLNNNTSSLPQLQIKRSKELGRRMPPMHAMQ